MSRIATLPDRELVDQFLAAEAAIERGPRVPWPFELAAHFRALQDEIAKRELDATVWEGKTA